MDMPLDFDWIRLSISSTRHVLPLSPLTRSGTALSFTNVRRHSSALCSALFFQFGLQHLKTENSRLQFAVVQFLSSNRAARVILISEPESTANKYCAVHVLL